MTFKRNAQAMALATAAVLATAGGLQAATCEINMPASGNSAATASVNANIAAVLQAQYPGVSFTPASPTQGTTVSVPNCNGADFANTGANVSAVSPNLPAGAGNAQTQLAAAVAAGLALILVLTGDNGTTTTTTTTTGPTSAGNGGGN